MAVFEDLNNLNVNDHSEKKNVEGKDLTYLSWPWAWAEVKKRYPDAHYTIWKNEKGLPYTEDPMTGYMVYTSVTIDGVTHEMWLPVMNGANRAMKREPYSYSTKYGQKNVEAATMMDINKTIMRCLVKNLAMFGLGLYIYAGEDLPEVEQDDQMQEKTTALQPQCRNAAEQPKNTAYSATVTTQAKVPAPAPKAEKPEEKAQVIEPPKTATDLLKLKIAMFKEEDPTFDFLKARAALIAGGVIKDIPSATMTMEQAVELMNAIDANCVKKAR